MVHLFRKLFRSEVFRSKAFRSKAFWSGAFRFRRSSVRKLFQYDIGQDADDSAAYDARNYQDRKVYEDLQIRDKECGNQDLPQIVGDATGYGNSCD